MKVSFLVNCANDEYILFDGLLKTKSFQFEADGSEHLVSSFPIGGKNLPQTARISTNKIEFTGAVKVTKWSEDYFELSFEKVEVECYQTPQIISQKQLSDKGLLHTATLYADSRQRLMIENQFTSATFDMLEQMQNPQIELHPLSFGVLIVVLGNVGDRKHLSIILAENNYKLLYQGVADYIDFFEDGFVTRTHLKDMLGRVKEESFSFEPESREYVLVLRKFSYTNDRKYIPNLTQFLFLEAIACEDFERAQSYLSTELNAKEVAQFIGKFESIESPRAMKREDTKAAILVQDEKVLLARELKFEIQDSKIVNISI